MELTKTFPHDQYVRALESWSWLSFEGLAPMFTSLFGDIFFAAVDGSWWRLDHLEGTLERRWADRSALAADLSTDDGQDTHLYGVLAMAAHRRGLELGPDDVYMFVPHPMVGGDFSIERIQVFSFVAAMHITGQLHALPSPRGLSGHGDAPAR